MTPKEIEIELRKLATQIKAPAPVTGIWLNIHNDRQTPGLNWTLWNGDENSFGCTFEEALEAFTRLHSRPKPELLDEAELLEARARKLRMKAASL